MASAHGGRRGCLVWNPPSAAVHREQARRSRALRYFPSLTRLLPDMVQFSRFAQDRATAINDQMTTAPMSVPGSEFNDFLFAPIGEDKNGMLVSVLSGLARSDVDPWQEAAKLA